MKRYNLYRVALFLFFVAILFSCSKDPKVDPVVAPKGRTILVYVALDNNLYGEMEGVHASLMEGYENLENEGSLLLFADTKGDKYPQLIKIEKHKGVVVSDTLLAYQNENSASPELLRRVIADTKLIAPAKSYGLMLFSHATGWLPAKAFQNPARWGAAVADNQPPVLHSIFEDSGREMEFADFVEAIPDGMFDFIASEMCFMSSVETAYALRNKTKYLLAAATEVLSYGFQPIYENYLAMLFEDKPDLNGFAKAFFDHVDGLKGEKRSATISVVKTSELEALANITRNINLELSQEQVDRVQVFDRKGKPNVFFDFADYIRQAATPRQMTEIEKQLDKAVIFKRNTSMFLIKYGGFIITTHSGLSTYIPQDGLPKLNEAYQDTDWYKAIVN